jgi:hypothetical protein
MGAAAAAMRKAGLAAALLLLATSAGAHIGSPDVFFEGSAGPYRLLVVVRMPAVIPGVADIQIRSLSADVRSLRVVPMRIRGPGAELAPVADVAVPDAADAHVFRAQLWIMQRGAWKVQIDADGGRGAGSLSVPLAAVSTMARPMPPALKALLAAAGLLLAVGLVGIVGAAAREATSPPGAEVSSERRRRARVAMACAAAVTAAVLWGGHLWWRVEAAANAAAVYKIPRASLWLSGPRTLSLLLDNPNGRRVPMDDLVPDHGHLVHLFLVRSPGLDRMLHLHPRQLSRARFDQELPALSAGRYLVFADIVHASGFPETEIGEVALPEIGEGETTGDDSRAAAAPFALGPASAAVAPIGGGRMSWLREAAPLRAGEPVWLRFRVEDASGDPATDLEPYMGMAAHLAVVRADGSVFAHLHPGGSAPMAAVALANGGATAAHAGHGVLPAEIRFPYGFPQPGGYRLFVQVKRAGRVETGVFDARVEAFSASQAARVASTAGSSFAKPASTSGVGSVSAPSTAAAKPRSVPASARRLARPAGAGPTGASPNCGPVSACTRMSRCSIALASSAPMRARSESARCSLSASSIAAATRAAAASTRRASANCRA